MDQNQEGISLENHVFCGIIETRLATLLEQIVAFGIVSKSGYEVAKMGSELDKFGYEFTKKQESIYSLLQQLTNPIRAGNLKAALVEVASNARDQNQKIQELFPTKFFQLYEEIDEALAGDDDDLKEECMEALIIGLVNLIVSLFGARFQQLIPHASQYIDETLQAHLNGASQNLNQFKMTMNEADKQRLKENYMEIVSRFNFERYFPCQKQKVLSMLVQSQHSEY
ncbi:hypothetical protein EB796_003383 [Bugula neritina]|uniref:Uncharacterized protein n=1 Tax=Bugula neritina TaxID=10212 RepID=A0A7J7KIB8_BUGNE|nr:hypothetical protein EB796_003383 [Bugula neritina]